MIKEKFTKEYESLVKTYEEHGGKVESLKMPNVAHLVVEQNNVLSSGSAEGVFVDTQKLPTGVKIKLRVEKWRKIEHPVHLCFGVLPKEGLQEIFPEIVIEDGASVKLLAHCIFPNAVNVRHFMDGQFYIGKAAALEYTETHFHGDNGGVKVIPKLRSTVEKYGKLRMSFGITTGRVGKLDIDYDVSALEDSSVELMAKIFGRADDEIKIRESVNLDGEGARSIIKSRVAVRDRATSEITNITHGNKPFSRGHVDCTEVVQGQARASAVPIVSVKDFRAKVTHEAAIGSVDKKELETLEARGLTEDDAIETIIAGLLK